MNGLFSKLRSQRGEESICSAIVVAAGSARRMQGIDKILTPLGEMPTLVHTLRVFQSCKRISEVVIVTREDLLLEVGRVCKEYELDKVTKVVIGGAERINSVQAGLAAVRPDATMIAIHDGARPLLPTEVLEEVLSCAEKTGAAAPALPITDTIKRVEDGVAVETVDRNKLFAVQTPQTFDADLIRAAVKKAIDDGELLTDDCAAVERIGMKVTLTKGSRENMKLTTPFDLIVANAILEKRGEKH